MARDLGKLLNRHYRRGAKQARYGQDGIWYHLLERFPADLYDANGVVRFESDAHYRTYIRVGPEDNSTHADKLGVGISKIPGYAPLNPQPRDVI
jgi:hypothetical protein